MSNVDPEFGDGEEEEVGARLSRLENLVGNLERWGSSVLKMLQCLEVSVIPLPVRAGVGQYCNVFFYPLPYAGLSPGSVTTRGRATCHPISS